MSLKEITIIITTLRSEANINSCLDSIDSSVKVIIVENSNNLEFKKNIEKKYQNVECFLTGTNLGYGKANNLGLQKVKSKYALILNPDTILKSNALDKFLNSANDIKNFSLIGPNQDENLNKIIDKKVYEANNLKGFAVFFNMQKFNDQNFFDENYFLYFEEIDLCKRIKEEGKKIFIDENIEILHLGGKSVSLSDDIEIVKNRNWHWMWSSFYYHKKHGNFILAFFKIFPKLISSTFKYLFFLIFFNKKKKIIYLYRLKGIINSIIGKKSWYRPTLD